MSYRLVLVEGAAETEFLARALVQLRGCQKVAMDSEGVPPALSRRDPPPGSQPDVAKVVPLMRCVRSSTGEVVVILQCGGDSGVLGPVAEGFVTLCDQASKIGFVIDADDVGAHRRLESFRQRFGNHPGFDESAGLDVFSGDPPIGLHVIPDTEAVGALENLIIEHVRNVDPALFSAAEAFHDEYLSHKSGRKRNKAILGIVAQKLSPGSGLISVYQRHEFWSQASLPEDPEVVALIDFVLND